MPLTKTIALPPGPNPFRKEYPSLALLLPFLAVWLWHSRKEVCALPSWKLLPALTAENIQTLFFFEFPNETLIPSHLSLRLHIGLKAFGNYPRACLGDLLVELCGVKEVNCIYLAQSLLIESIFKDGAIKRGTSHAKSGYQGF
ncbi:hypothetical protein MRB53_018649 [Persea americana]|uniref:Uncharacterized protein n=1 Tax=Persea americana TaxID=3435 RepID=A0ACC2M8I5_PERAE|nr:hypothetical protein MRB53_018649 [Persea americana]